MYRPVERRLILPDAHVGLWEERNTHTIKDREEAAHALVDQSNELDAQIIIDGDGIDSDRSTEEAIEKEAKLFRAALKRARIPFRRIRGNHDDELEEDEAQELLGPHLYDPSEIFVDTAAGATFTHGHIFDNAKTLKRIRRLAATPGRRTREAVINHVCDKNILPKELKEMADYYSAVEAAERLHSYITKAGETILSMVGHHRKWLRWLVQFEWDPKRLKNKHFKEFLEYIDECMSPSEVAAAQLASMLGTSAVAIGHTHIQSVSVHHAWKKDHRETHDRILTGNGGSLVQTGQDLTWLLLETEPGKQQTMSLYKFNKEKREPELQQKQTLVLSASEAA